MISDRFRMKIVQSILSDRYSYVCDDSCEEYLLPIVEKAFNDYKYRILIVCKNSLDRQKAEASLDSLPHYQKNRVEYINIKNIDFVSSSIYDVIISYMVNDSIDYLQLETLFELARISQYVQTKLIFLNSVDNEMTKARITLSNGFVSTIQIGEPKTPRFICHELNLDTVRREYQYVIDNSTSNNPAKIELDFPQHLSQLTSNISRADTIVTVNCTQSEFYRLATIQVGELTGRLRVLKRTCDREDCVNKLKDVMLLRRTFLSDIKEDALKHFMGEHTEEKVALQGFTDSLMYNLFGDNYISIDKNRDEVDNITAMYNQGALKHIGIRGECPKYIQLPSTELFVLSYITGAETDLIDELCAENLNIIAHLFYFANTIEEEGLVTLLDGVPDDLICEND